jgi:hypothetical protein
MTQSEITETILPAIAGPQTLIESKSQIVETGRTEVLNNVAVGTQVISGGVVGAPVVSAGVVGAPVVSAGGVVSTGLVGSRVLTAPTVAPVVSTVAPTV